MSDLFDLAAKKGNPKEPLDFFREHRLSVFVWPDAWRNAQSEKALNWESVDFGREAIPDIPEQRGLYAFVISVRNSIMPTHGVIVYFGETSRTLRARYKEYVRDCNMGSKRTKIYTLFKNWSGDLNFYFAPIDDANCDLKKIEEALNDAVIPQCVTDDFSAEIRRIVPILRG